MQDVQASNQLAHAMDPTLLAALFTAARPVAPPTPVLAPTMQQQVATMLAGAAVMDSALLLVAGNQPCPQPQTREHLAAIEIMDLEHVIVL